MIENITLFTDASFCERTRSAGGAFWARTGNAYHTGAFPIHGCKGSHEAELLAACMAVLQLPANQTFKDELTRGRQTRLVLVTDCLTVQRVLGNNSREPLTPLARSLMDMVLKMRDEMGFWMKVNHVKAHSGHGTPRQYINDWCDREAKKQMRKQRDKKE